jgi:hypothetical protein
MVSEPLGNWIGSIFGKIRNWSHNIPRQPLSALVDFRAAAGSWMAQGGDLDLKVLLSLLVCQEETSTTWAKNQMRSLSQDPKIVPTGS